MADPGRTDVWSLCRPLALSQLAIGVSTGLLMVTSRAETLLLFTGRAASMGSFAILYVYTPEVCPPAALCEISVYSACNLTVRAVNVLEAFPAWRAF